MVRKDKRVAKGFQWAKVEKLLRKVGVWREDAFIWRHFGKCLLSAYTVCALAWLYDETSPLGWWNLQPRPKEEKELSHLYERRQFPYPGDKEAMEDFIAKGGMIGTTIGPKGDLENDADSSNYRAELQKKKLDNEALKLWIRMRNEVISELQEKGYDVE